MDAIAGQPASEDAPSFPSAIGHRFQAGQHDTRMIDEEVRDLVDQAYKRTVALVREKKPVVEALAQGQCFS